MNTTTLNEAKEALVERLREKGFTVDDWNPDQHEIRFSLTNIGLPVVYATISDEEVEYYAANHLEALSS